MSGNLPWTGVRPPQQLVGGYQENVGIFQCHLPCPSPSSTRADSFFLEYPYTVLAHDVSSWKVTFPTHFLTSKFPWNLGHTHPKSPLLGSSLLLPIMAQMLSSFFEILNVWVDMLQSLCAACSWEKEREGLCVLLSD